MQKFVTDKQLNGHSTVDVLPPEDKQKLVSAFAWLIEEDKKQNPSLYQLKKL